MKMKSHRRINVCLLVFVLVVTMLLPEYATAIVSAPITYPYGLGSLAEDPADAKQMLVSEWEAWKDKFVSKTGGKRVLMDGPTTVSPGMGYGLLFSVYFNEQTLFDELYEYVESCLDSNGLMHWKTQNGIIVGSGSDALADQYIALALIFADKIWGSDGTINYKNEGKTLLAKIYQYEVLSGELLMSDAVTNPRSPSYMIPAFYEIFRDFDKSHDWGTVSANAYRLIIKARHATTGLVPDWCDRNGTPYRYGPSDPVYYGYEAVKTLLHMALSYSWYGHTDAKTICDKVTAFFKNIGAADIKANYELNGTVQSDYHTDVFVYSAAVGFMTGTDRQTATVFYQEALDMSSSLYYGSSLRLLSLMYMTGYFQNLYNGGSPIIENEDAPATEDADTDEGYSDEGNIDEEDIDEEYIDEQDSDEDEEEPEEEEPDMEIILTATGGSGVVTLEWNDLEGISGYYVYKATQSGEQGDTPETDFWVSKPTYKDTKVKPGTKYYYIVRPVLEDQTPGDPSNEAVATTRGTATQASKPVGKKGTIVITISNATMKVNGKSKTIDAIKSVTPVISSGRAYAPVDVIIKEMGGKVSWDSKQSKLTITVSDNILEFWMEKTTITVNGIKKTIDVAPYLSKNGAKMLPLRYVMENLGCDLTWENGKPQKITIEYDFR